MKFLKNINWGNVAMIAVVAVIVGVFIVPRARPLIAKVPFLGKFVSA